MLRLGQILKQKVERAKTKASMEQCLDSGASSHMNNDLQFFSNIRYTKTDVFLADSYFIKASQICFFTEGGKLFLYFNLPTSQA